MIQFIGCLWHLFFKLSKLPIEVAYFPHWPFPYKNWSRLHLTTPQCRIILKLSGGTLTHPGQHKIKTSAFRMVKTTTASSYAMNISKWRLQKTDDSLFLNLLWDKFRQSTKHANISILTKPTGIVQISFCLPVLFLYVNLLTWRQVMLHGKLPNTIPSNAHVLTYFLSVLIQLCKEELYKFLGSLG